MAKPKSAYVKERLAQIAADVTALVPSASDTPVSTIVNTPVFDPDGPYSLMSNGWRVQRKWYFGPDGTYIGEADRGLWLPELTPEQERERKATIARQKATFAAKTKMMGRPSPPPVPQKVVDNARENAEALRAEAYAE